MDGWIGSLTEWLVIPVGGNSQMAITSDAEVMILAWYEHLFSSCAGIFCRLKSETLHPLFPPLLFPLPTSLFPSPPPCRCSSEGHELELAFTRPLGHPDGVGGVLRLHGRRLWHYLSREGGRKQDRGASTRAANHPPGAFWLEDRWEGSWAWMDWGWSWLVTLEDEQGASKSVSLSFPPAESPLGERLLKVRREGWGEGLGVDWLIWRCGRREGGGAKWKTFS